MSEEKWSLVTSAATKSGNREWSGATVVVRPKRSADW